ncbi:MAG: valine--tRNA ligase [Bacteroidales bacterium]|nr:valine--tRNA ligase [Bacteroidales bacterium]
MDIPSKYDPRGAENKWHRYWLEQGFFKSVPDEREPYTIVIPPPNVTGVLHMGHMLNNTIQDILVRRARMLGKNTCWVPGTDHASIATEAKVVVKLKDEGINKSDLSREEFLRHAWDWKEKHGGIILEQLKKLGASCDWDRTSFTMDEKLSESVIKVFIHLYNKGYIYRGVRMVNWDPQAKTAVSDEEVIYKEEQSKLYYVRYKIVGTENEWVTIATTRPETILGDTAVCVNPNDRRFLHLKDKKVVVPVVNRVVPIIFDDYVDMEFGTGCLKITPAHDENDYEIGLRHKLDSIDIFNDDGTLSEKAEHFIGEDRFKARIFMVNVLEKNENLVKVEDYINKVGYSERTDVVIEPRLSAQWFLKMKELAKPALDNVMNDNIKFHPAKFKNLYRHWMENIKDWCISRQLWWGHRIPVYYLPDGNFVVAETIGEALEKVKTEFGRTDIKEEDLKQDEDVLDTWASSWLWPISLFDGINNPDNPEIKYYYPTNDLVTAPDIIFFWVARMIIAGYEFLGDKPFSNVYFTGMVRDKQRRKMSKSLGNSPDPLELIEKYGADGVRVGMLLCSPAGNDLLFDEILTEQGRNFSNKIWNVFRLIKNWKVDHSEIQPESSKIAIEWFENLLNKTIKSIDSHFSKFRISSALMEIYTLIRDDFSGWYLEAVKPAYQKPIDSVTLEKTILYFDSLLRILHPFMPFITEEIFQLIEERKPSESITISEMPTSGKYNKVLLASFNETKEIVAAVRNIRQEKSIANKEPVKLKIITKEDNYSGGMIPIIKKLANVSDVSFSSTTENGEITFMIKTTRYSIPLGSVIDTELEKKKLEDELKYHEGFLKSVMKKLGNESFIENAPAKVVELERKKQADAEEKIKTLKEQLETLA